MSQDQNETMLGRDGDLDVPTASLELSGSVPVIMAGQADVSETDTARAPLSTDFVDSLQHREPAPTEDALLGERPVLAVKRVELGAHVLPPSPEDDADQAMRPDEPLHLVAQAEPPPPMPDGAPVSPESMESAAVDAGALVEGPRVVEPVAGPDLAAESFSAAAGESYSVLFGTDHQMLTSAALSPKPVSEKGHGSHSKHVTPQHHRSAMGSPSKDAQDSLALPSAALDQSRHDAADEHLPEDAAAIGPPSLADHPLIEAAPPVTEEEAAQVEELLVADGVLQDMESHREEEIPFSPASPEPVHNASPSFIVGQPQREKMRRPRINYRNPSEWTSTRTTRFKASRHSLGDEAQPDGVAPRPRTRTRIHHDGDGEPAPLAGSAEVSAPLLTARKSRTRTTSEHSDNQSSSSKKRSRRLLIGEAEEAKQEFLPTLGNSPEDHAPPAVDQALFPAPAELLSASPNLQMAFAEEQMKQAFDETSVPNPAHEQLGLPAAATGGDGASDSELSAVVDTSDSDDDARDTAPDGASSMGEMDGGSEFSADYGAQGRRRSSRPKVTYAASATDSMANGSGLDIDDLEMVESAAEEVDGRGPASLSGDAAPRKRKGKQSKKKASPAPADSASKRKRAAGSASDVDGERAAGDGVAEAKPSKKRKPNLTDPFSTTITTGSSYRYFGAYVPAGLQNPFRQMERRSMAFTTAEDQDMDAIKHDITVQEQQAIATSEVGNGDAVGESTRRSHRKPASTFDSRLFSPPAVRDLRDFSELDDSIKNQLNEDFCAACDVTSGQLMCCDSCPKSFHFLCANPPLDPQNLPEGLWECRACVGKKVQAERPKDKQKDTIFGPLLRNLEVMNPKMFRLPSNIRRSFIGYVRHPETGDYMDLSETKITRSSKPMAPEAMEHVSAVCFKCCRTDTMPKIIQCDFCDLWWHLDCLTPPLAISPNLAVLPLEVSAEGSASPSTTPKSAEENGSIVENKQRDEDEEAEKLLASGMPLGLRKKWMCPCHADWELPFKRRKARGETLVDVSADGPSVSEPWNDGHIQVVLDSADRGLGIRDAFNSADKVGAAIVGGPGLDALRKSAAARSARRGSQDSDSEAESASSGTRLRKNDKDVVRFRANSDFRDMEHSSIVYRVSEARIKLDFLHRAGTRKASPSFLGSEMEGSEVDAALEDPGHDAADKLLALAEAALQMVRIRTTIGTTLYS
ncbi:hypothetical protein DFJ74DRAFT_660315 [Hyaloraphidium curvatum]|nr:hypothetical protein DFJ74DRAFT_660315 [Hyaloraphidium curvatum]